MDIFSKHFICVPVNDALHWSLCVVINPGLVTAFNDDKVDVEVPCVIFLDSLKSHSRKEVAQNMHMWLNAEWKRKYSVNENLFTPLTMGCFSSKGMFSMSLLMVMFVYVSLQCLIISSNFY
jgi:Ulp1 family protease